MLLAAFVSGGAAIPTLPALGQPEVRRPATVPRDAFWCGGLDGGVFVRIAATAPKTFRATVFHDRSAAILFRGVLRADDRRMAVVDIRRRCDGWDGDVLRLTDGRSLAR